MSIRVLKFTEKKNVSLFLLSRNFIISYENSCNYSIINHLFKLKNYESKIEMLLCN